VWTLIAVLSVIIVLGAVIAGYQIHQLQSDINGLNHQLTFVNQGIQKRDK
jgi:hypothetical protein